jgi:hypothetical protein
VVAVYAFRYSKAQLDRAPEDERTFFLMLCHLINDATYFQKVALFALNRREQSGPVATSATMLALTMLRMLAGRLREGLPLIQDQWARLVQRYPEIPEAQTKAREIRRYFNPANNLVHRIRNDAGFHETPEHVRDAYNAFHDEEPLIDYMAEEMGNSIYSAADLIRAIAMQRIVGAPDMRTALETMATEIVGVSSMFSDFANEFIPAFYERYIPEIHENELEAMRIDVPSRPLNEIVMEFYADPPNAPVG